MNTALTVYGACSAALLASNDGITAAATVRRARACACVLRCALKLTPRIRRTPQQAVNNSASALWVSYETVRVNTEAAELASEATMTDDAAAVSRAAADAAAAVALANYNSQALTASTAAEAAKATASTAAAAAALTAWTAAFAAALVASNAAAAAAATALTAAQAAAGSLLPPPAPAPEECAAPVLLDLPPLSSITSEDAAWNAYLTDANTTALIVQTTAWNAAVAVQTICHAELLASNTIIAAAATVRAPVGLRSHLRSALARTDAPRSHHTGCEQQRDDAVGVVRNRSREHRDC